MGPIRGWSRSVGASSRCLGSASHGRLQTVNDVRPPTATPQWGRSVRGSGKRGGARVIYFYHDANHPLYLLMVYAKARQEDLTPDEKRAVRKSAGELKGWTVERIDAMGKFAKELITSLTQAAAHARGGNVRGLRVTVVEVPDVKAIRRSLRMSQNRFSAAYRIPLATLKNWEQGRRYPDAPAAAYLLAIKKRPKEIMEAVAH
ncbi:MAG: type II toxin-antitoxin system RelE/ParE family toxin [Hyphomicrobiales bacterium]